MGCGGWWRGGVMSFFVTYPVSNVTGLLHNRIMTFNIHEYFFTYA